MSLYLKILSKDSGQMIVWWEYVCECVSLIFRLCVNLPLNTEIAHLYSMQTQDPNAIELPKRQEQVSKWAEMNAPTIESDQLSWDFGSHQNLAKRVW